jgi:hypothetical protein
MEESPARVGLFVDGPNVFREEFDVDLDDIREAAASIHSDILLLYTFDTDFSIEGHNIGPLSVISLGFAPNKEAHVTTTASAAFYDVRTGYVYGTAEATHTTSHLANTWNKEQAVDNARLRTEKAAFSKLADNLASTWKGIANEYSRGNRSNGA